MSYYNLCGIGSQHSNISKGKKKGGGLHIKITGIRAPDELRIYVFYAMKTSKNGCIIRSECTLYAYILLCKQTFQIRSVLVQFVHNNTFLSLRNSP